MSRSETPSNLPSRTRERRSADWGWYVGLTLLALVLRLGLALADGKAALSWGDEFVYDQLATNLLQFGCFCFVPGTESVWRPPLYSYLLAAFYATVGRSFLAVIILQAFVGALTVPLVVWFGKEVSQRVWAGRLAGLLVAVNPILIYAGTLLYTETLFIFILLVVVCSLQLLGLATRFRYWIAAGVGALLGAETLLRPTLQLLPLFLFGWAIIGEPKVKHGVRLVAVLTLTMVVVMLPWTVRNYSVTGSVVLVSANSGLNLFQGNYDGADGSALPLTRVPPLRGLTEKQRDDAYWQMGLEWIKAYPVKFVSLAPLKLSKFFSPIETSNRGALFEPFAPLLYGVTALYYLVGLIGVAFSFREWRRWLLPYLLIAYPAAVAILFSGGTRYGMVTQPFVALFVALAICVLVPKISRNPGFKLRTADGG